MTSIALTERHNFREELLSMYLKFLIGDRTQVGRYKLSFEKLGICLHIELNRWVCYLLSHSGSYILNLVTNLSFYRLAACAEIQS